MEKAKKPVILITNDDGYRAKGIKALIEALQPFGHLVVISPSEGQSGMAHAITVKVPLRMEKVEEKEDLEFYVCTGTPVDCVKLANNQLFRESKPDLLVSGINHGANSSSSVVYSGTMAAAIEGCLYEIPSIGFSLLDFSRNADFSATIEYIRKISKNVLEHGLKPGVCLNVNIPKLPAQEIKGIRVCRQNKGVWKEEFDKRLDPSNREYYWLTGEFYNLEPHAEDTDEWALHHGYVSIVPVQVDLTAYETIKQLNTWDWSL
ncbi:MAG TPA: 5'/3'-nucleotidase SurE [Bacteroidales bacterium]|nr:5'/3'-nucleotidase SurE [Bacteroidales bacterium]